MLSISPKLDLVGFVPHTIPLTMAIKGLIRPPPEIRAVADKTALYVAKNGRAFEARILNSEKGKMPKFAFLQLSSPFHAYYEDRLAHYEETERNGGKVKVEDDGDGAEEKFPQGKVKAGENAKVKNDEAKPKEAPKPETTKKASVIDPIAKTLLIQRSKINQARANREKEDKEKQNAGDPTNGEAEQKRHTTSVSLPPPPPLELISIVAPSSLTPVQIETIQLVAQFTAMDGKGGPFLPRLSMREWTNPDFAFCQPRHPNFAYFSALVDAYRRIMTVLTTNVLEESPAGDKEMQVSHGDLEKELEQAAYRAEYERDTSRLRSQQEQEENEILAINWHDFVVVETIDFPVDEAVELSMLPPPPLPPKRTGEAESSVAAPKPVGEDEMEESGDDDDDDDDDEPIRVVPSYTPVVVKASNPQNARAIDPITGKSVAVADVPEHLRIQLLDPKWAEERRKFQEKQKDSNLVSGDAIANNISRFAQARGDLFGKSEQELLSSAQDSKKRLEEANRVIREQAILPSPPSIAPQPSASMLPPPPPPPSTAAPSGLAGSVRKLEVENLAEPPPKRTRIVAPPPVAQNSDTQPELPPQAFDPIAAITPLDSEREQMSSPTGADGSEPVLEGANLIPEAEFAASLSKPEVTLQIRIPNDPSQMAWNFYGQILSMSVNVMSKVKEVKAELSKLHLNGMPPNKIQFKDANHGFLKDSSTLASLNIGPTATLEMKRKTRAGRK